MSGVTFANEICGENSEQSIEGEGETNETSRLIRTAAAPVSFERLPFPVSFELVTKPVCFFSSSNLHSLSFVLQHNAALSTCHPPGTIQMHAL